MQSVSIALDRFGNAVQAIAPDATVNAAIAATSTAVALPAITELVRVVATGNCFINFGTSAAVTATSANTPVLTGTEIFKVPVGATHVAVIQLGAATGTTYFTKMV